MFRKALLLLLASSAIAQTSDWNWDQCDATNGPTNWPGACKNQKTGGTPIDLCGAVAFPSGAPTVTITGYDVKRNLNVVSDGKTVQINIVDNFPTLNAGTLSTLVGRGTSTTAQSWTLAQMHLHWGRTGLVNEGSEHYMQGRRYPIEAHFVHINSQYKDVAEAAGSGKADSLLVVGVFLDIATKDVDVMKAIGDAVSTASSTPKPLATQERLDDLYDGTGDFYSYGGSLTTPTCLEQVTWIVMTEVKPITSSTLENIKKAAKADGTLISKYGNYRPIQPIGGRTLYSTTGATASCLALSEPVWSCPKTGGTNSGFMSSPSILCQVLALCVAFLVARQ